MIQERDVQAILKRRALTLAAPLEDSSDSTSLALGIFSVGSYRLAVPLSGFRYVFDVVSITAIPRAPAHFLGVCVAGGHVVTLLNTGQFLHLPSVVAADLRSGVVIGHGERSIAFGARELLGIEEVDARIPRPIQHEASCLTRALDDVLIIDPALVFSDRRLSGAKESG